VGGYGPPGNAIWLTDLIQQGTREFVGIVIEPDAESPIIADRDRPEFFRAIIERDDAALPRLVDLDAWRSFVHDNGPIPQERSVRMDVV
jgi:hypothetical protein